jgi:isopentenyl-diphosphate delta-isomerase type 1
MKRDNCILVDDNDNVIGGANKHDAHRFTPATPQGLLHRAFSVFLFDSTGRLILQQRAEHKITFPGASARACVCVCVSASPSFWLQRRSCFSRLVRCAGRPSPLILNPDPLIYCARAPNAAEHVACLQTTRTSPDQHATDHPHTVTRPPHVFVLCLSPAVEGVWTNTCCSHQLSGQQPDELDTPAAVADGSVPGAKAAALRKLAHELGVPQGSLRIEDLRYVTRLHYCAPHVLPDGSHSGWGEHEIDYILLAQVRPLCIWLCHCCHNTLQSAGCEVETLAP